MIRGAIVLAIGYSLGYGKGYASGLKDNEGLMIVLREVADTIKDAISDPKTPTDSSTDVIDGNAVDVVDTPNQPSTTTPTPEGE